MPGDSVPIAIARGTGGFVVSGSNDVLALLQQIDAFAHKYLGVDSYPYRVPGAQRIKFVLQPERVHYNAPR